MTISEPDHPDVVPGWHRVADSHTVTARPQEVTAGGRDYVVFRPEPGGPVAAVAARCPHRLVRLSHADLVEGRLRCAYHGWEFSASGDCVLIPSNGPDAAIPPRAALEVPWGLREQQGSIWIAPTDPAQQSKDSDTGQTTEDRRGTEQLFTNLDPSLRNAWHPVALAGEVGDGPRRVRLLGEEWTLRRSTTSGQVCAEKDGSGGATGHVVRERFGVVWLAPQEPVHDLIENADDGDPQFVGAWLEPIRTHAAATVLAENFLDVAHFPFVHAATFGAAEEPYVEPFDVQVGGAGLTSTQDQWFDNPQDPAVVAGTRAIRQRRRATYTYRVPLQLTLRLEELDAGAIKTILFFLQPEDLDSTRIYTKMVLHGIGGNELPTPQQVADEVAFEVRVLAEDLNLQRAMTVPGLPLRLRDELHVRSDRSGVALRRLLAHFATPTEEK